VCECVSWVGVDAMHLVFYDNYKLLHTFAMVSHKLMPAGY
jgi:hypothetical protein